MIKFHRPEISTVGWPPCVAVNNDDARRGVSGRATCGYMRHVGPQRQYFAVLPKHIPPQISGASLPSEYHMYSKSNPACRHAPRTSSSRSCPASPLGNFLLTPRGHGCMGSGVMLAACSGLLPVAHNTMVAQSRCYFEGNAPRKGLPASTEPRKGAYRPLVEIEGFLTRVFSK